MNEPKGKPSGEIERAIAAFDTEEIRAVLQHHLSVPRTSRSRGIVGDMFLSLLQQELVRRDEAAAKRLPSHDDQDKSSG